jgi:beta-glucosidase-like glycosyl hydrolase
VGLRGVLDQDPILTAHLLKACVTGLQEGSQTANSLGETIYETVATCKHFVGYHLRVISIRTGILN